MHKDVIRKTASYIGIIILFAVIAYGFVPQVLSGKIVNQSDISSWKGMAQEAVSHNQSHPEDPTAWTNSMFGGMPTTAMIDDFDGDWTKAIYDLLLSGRRRSEEHTSELQSQSNLVCRLLLEKKKNTTHKNIDIEKKKK